MLTSFILAGLFYASNVIGFALTTLVVITLLTMSYSIRYWREGIGVFKIYTCNIRALHAGLKLVAVCCYSGIH